MEKNIRRCAALLALLLLTSALCACAPKEAAAPADYMVDPVQLELVDIEDEAVALSSSPAAMPAAASVSAPGTKTKSCADAVIDYSNAADGYVMVQYKTKTTQRLKVRLAGPTTTYTYNIGAQEWVAFPFSDGNGSYKITVFRNVSGNSYASVLSLTLGVEMADEFGPFLHSNQYVDYDAAPNTVARAKELIGDKTDPLEKVAAVYAFVVNNVTYDNELAATVKSGYLPVLDTVLERKTGICFDYAALMTGMLRSQGVPCKLVVGYAGTAYHAWISVWSETDGWLDGAIWFDGESWMRMDPTFASSAGRSDAILEYIGDGENYTAKYFY